jgi:sortase A
MLLCGLAVLSYPVAADILSSGQQAGVIRRYCEDVSKLDEADIIQKHSSAAEYNAALVAMRDRIQIPPALQNRLESYEQALSENGVIGYLDIRSIKIHIPVYSGTNDNVLAQGIGHLSNTALPTGKKGEHTALAGHTGLADAKLFDQLQDILLGDCFTLFILDEKLNYKVDNIAVVNPGDTELLEPDSRCNYVTLITCTPPLVNTHRLLVRGILTSKEQLVLEKQENSIHHITTLQVALANMVFISCNAIIENAPLILALLMILACVRSWLQRKYRHRH